MKQVKFYDKENDDELCGILTDDADIICGCCGSLIPSSEIGDDEDCTYSILKIYDEWVDFSDFINDNNVR